MKPAPVLARTSSPVDTQALAAALATVLVPGDLLLLVGGLGTGKTTFVQGLARGLGVTEPVTSPTFTLVRAYPAHAGAVRTLLHADLYRLTRLSDVVDLGLGEMVEDDAVAAVEWGDMARAVFGPDTLTVVLEAGRAEADRRIGLVTDGAFAPRAPALAEALRPWACAAGRPA